MTETAVGVMIETVAVVTAKMTAVMAEMVVAVMTMTAAEGTAKMAVMTEMAVAVYQRGRWFVSSVSGVRIMWNITPLATHSDTPTALPTVRATLTVLMNNSSLNIWSGEIQSKYINKTG
jgi:hypothetical protein